MIDFISVFIFFFAVVDPIGTIPIFIAVTAKHTEKEKRKVAAIAILAASGVLVFFVIAGEIILSAMGIPLSAFQIAGGVILFLFALTMIFGDGKPKEELKLVNNISEAAIFPLAMPSIASPGAMLAAVLLTENSQFSVIQQTQVTAMLLLVLFITFLFMLLATKIHKFVGNSGASIISRVMGLILASVATANTLEGIKIYFNL